MIGQLEMGLQGAALATAIGYSISAFIGLFFFMLNRKGKLYLSKPKFEFGILSKSVMNGLSEFVSMMSISVVSIISNNILMDMFMGELNVAAIGVSFGLMGILSSIFIGFSSGIMPVIGFNFGQNNTDRLKKIFKTSLFAVISLSIASVILAWLLTSPLVRIYFNRYEHGILYDMTINAFRIITAGFIFNGLNSFASMFFTGLNNGKVSAIISASNTLILPIIALATLPNLMQQFNLNSYIGVYLAAPFAEAITIIVSITIFVLMRKKYKYA